MPKPHTPKFYFSNSSEKGKYLLERGDAEKEKQNIGNAIKYYEEARKYCNDEAQIRLEKINPLFASGGDSISHGEVESSPFQFKLTGPYFPTSLLQSESSFDSISPETSLFQGSIDHTIQDVPSTFALSIMFRNADNETKKLINKTIDQMIQLFDENSTSKESIQELAVLATIPDQRIFIAIINRLLKVEKDSPTFPELTIYGLAVILTSAPKEIDLKERHGLLADILDRLKFRLDKTRCMNNNEELLPLLRALSALFDAILCRKMRYLGRLEVYNPINDRLQELASDENIDPEVSFLARYASQSLAYIGNDESLEMSIFRRGRLAIGIIVDIKSAVLDFDPGVFESVYDKIVSMSDFTIKMEWYQGLLFLDCLLANNDLPSFEKFVIESKLNSNEYFMQGVCLRLEQITSSNSNQEVFLGSQRLLRDLASNPARGVQLMAQMILKRSNTTSSGSASALKTMQPLTTGLAEDLLQPSMTVRLSPVLDKSWYIDNNSHLLKEVQKSLKLESNIHYLDRIIPAANNMDEVNKILMDNYSSQLTIRRVSGSALSLESCYVNLAIVEASDQRKQDKENLEKQQGDFIRMPSYEEVSSTNKQKPIPLEEILDMRKLLNGKVGVPKRILVIGRAGVGKTTFCKKLIHIFQQGQWNGRFDTVLWLPLRLLKGYKSRIFEEFLIEWYFNNRVENERKGLAREFIKSAEKGKVLFILDGLDEFGMDTDSEDGSPLKALVMTLLNQQNVIITTRPYGNDRSLLRDIDLELETVGFSTENVEKYVKYVVKDPEDSQSVLDFIRQTPLIQGLVNIPIQLDLICFSWKDLISSTESVTITRLYEMIVRKLWCSDAVRMRKELEGSIASEKLLKNLLPDSLDLIMEPITEFLGYLAFRGLRDNHQLVFDHNYLATRGLELRRHRTSTNQSALPINLLDEVKNSSVLHQPDSEATIDSNSIETWNFIHLTFQEYFAAKWLSQYFQQEQPIVSEKSNLMDIDGTMEYIRLNKYNPRFEVVWWMIAGQLEGEALESYFQLLQAAPRDLIGVRHQLLISGCYKEANSRLSKNISNLIQDELRQWLRFELKQYEAEDYFYESILGKQSVFPEEILIKVVSGKGFEHVNMLQPLEFRRFLKQSSIEQLILMKNEDPDMATPVIKILGAQIKLSDSTAMELFTALHDESWNVREAAAKALQNQSLLPDSTIAVLVAALQEENRMVRYAAINILRNQSYFSDSTITALEAALYDKDSIVRYKAAEALGKQSSLPDSIIVTLIAALQDDDRNVRYAAAEAIGKQLPVSDSIFAVLVADLQDEKWQVREAAAEALGYQSSLLDSTITVLIAALSNENEIGFVRKSAAKALGKQSLLSDPAIEALIAFLKNDDTILSEVAAEALGNQPSLPDSAIAALVTALQNNSWNVRYSATKALGKQTSLSDSTMTELVTILNDENENIRLEAAKALGNQSPLPDFVITAISAFVQNVNEDLDIRCAAAEALGLQLTSLSESFIASLVAKLQSENSYDRQAAAEALISQSLSLPDSAIIALVTALQDKYPDVRKAAAFALGVQKSLSDSTTAAIIAALNDRNSSVRYAAALVLGSRSLLSDKLLLNLVTLPGLLLDKVDLYNAIGFRRIILSLRNFTKDEIETVYKRGLFYYCLYHHAAVFIHGNQLQAYSEEGYSQSNELDPEILDKIKSAFLAVQKEGGIQYLDHFYWEHIRYIE